MGLLGPACGGPSVSANLIHNYVIWANHCACAAGRRDSNVPSRFLITRKWKADKYLFPTGGIYQMAVSVTLRLGDCVYHLHYYRHDPKQK